MSDTDVRFSTFTVSVDGSDLDDAGKEKVRSIRVEQTTEGPALFSCTLNNPEEQVDPNFPDDKFKIGASVEIKLGYDDAPESLFKGEVTRINGIFAESEAPGFEIVGFDWLHRLTRNRVTKHWESVSYADVVSAIASDNGMSGDTDSTSITHDYVSMNGTTYLAFVLELAKRVGYDVWCEDKKLCFKKSRASESSAVTLTFGTDVKKARFRVQSAGQVTKVRVAAWDDVKKEQVIGEATDSDVTDKLGTSKVGPKVVDVFGDAEFWVSGYAARTQAEVDEVAKSMMNDKAMEFARVDAEVEGNPAITAGSVVTFDGVSGHFNGDYYVMRAIHMWDAGSGPAKGYRTRLLAQRPGWSV